MKYYNTGGFCQELDAGWDLMGNLANREVIAEWNERLTAAESWLQEERRRGLSKELKGIRHTNPTQMQQMWGVWSSVKNPNLSKESDDRFWGFFYTWKTLVIWGRSHCRCSEKCRGSEVCRFCSRSSDGEAGSATGKMPRAINGCISCRETTLG